MLARTLFLLISFLLMGLLLTVAVAWACSAWVPVGGGIGFEQTPRTEDGLTVIDIEQRAFGRTRVNTVAGEAPAVVNLFELITTGELDAERCRSEEHAGWPWRALRATHRGDVWLTSPLAQGPVSFSLVAAQATSGGIDLDDELLPNGSPIWRALPCRPMWLGLLLDVIFFAVLSAVLFFAVRFSWRRARRATDRCRQCGYDMRGGGIVCPECGASFVVESR